MHSSPFLVLIAYVLASGQTLNPEAACAVIDESLATTSITAATTVEGTESNSTRDFHTNVTDTGGQSADDAWVSVVLIVSNTSAKTSVKLDKLTATVGSSSFVIAAHDARHCVEDVGVKNRGSREAVQKCIRDQTNKTISEGASLLTLDGLTEQTRRWFYYDGNPPAPRKSDIKNAVSSLRRLPPTDQSKFVSMLRGYYLSTATHRPFTKGTSDFAGDGDGLVQDSEIGLYWFSTIEGFRHPFTATSTGKVEQIANTAIHQCKQQRDSQRTQQATAARAFDALLSVSASRKASDAMLLKQAIRIGEACICDWHCSNVDLSADSTPEDGGSKEPPAVTKAARNVADTLAETVPKEMISSVVTANGPSVAPCLKTARANKEIQKGKYTFALSWLIKSDGTVDHPELLGPSNVLSTSLPECFSAVLRQWKFPASQKGAEVAEFPFGPINLP